MQPYLARTRIARALKAEIWWRGIDPAWRETDAPAGEAGFPPQVLSAAGLAAGVRTGGPP